MKTTDKNTAKKAVNELKASIKADFLECIELVNYGIQVYNVIDGDEYSVITKAEKTNGRYYFITREGRRVAWSTIPTEKLETACNDFLAQMKADETAEISEHTTTRHNVTAARINQVATVIAESVGVAFGSSLPAKDIKSDLNNFHKWQGDADDVFYIAIRKQGSESGDRRHVRERCKILGAPVYVLRITREYDVKSDFAPAGRFCLSVWADHPITDDDQEDATPAAADIDNEPTDNGNDGATAENTTRRAADFIATTTAAAKKAARATAAALRRPLSWILTTLFFCVTAGGAVVVLVTVANAVAAVVGTHIATVLFVTFPVATACALAFEYLLILIFRKADRWNLIFNR